MESSKPNNPSPSSPELSDDSSLEGADNDSLEAAAPAGDSAAATPQSSDGNVAVPGGSAGAGGPSPPHDSWLHRLLSNANIYLLAFIGLLILAAVGVLATYLISRSSKTTPVQTQSLTESTLKQLANSDVTVGQPKQVLNVQSNAVFAGQVLVRDNLDVAGTLQVGGALSLPSITVSDTSIFGTTQVQKNLSVAGDTALQGQLAVQKNLSVAGGASFGGTVSVPQLTASSLQLNGDLNLTHHISAGGATPGRSNGNALGSGGSASVSGSDTAGSININTGSGAAAGCFVTINFTAKFNATPHVLVTPVGAAAGGLGFYVNRSTGSFSVCTTTTPPSSASFGFDYFVVD